MTLVFCSLSCWESHQSDARHRDAGAIEARSPTAAAWAREHAQEQEKNDAKEASAAPREMRRVVGVASLDVLLIASKFKEYIAKRASMNTSDRALGLLSDHLRKVSDQAIASAARDGRRTVMERDVLPLIARGMESLATGSSDPDDRPDEILVVVSKLKQYVKARSGMNTSDGVAPALSAYLRRLARKAIRVAATDDRKTVYDRDFTASFPK